LPEALAVVPPPAALAAADEAVPQGQDAAPDEAEALSSDEPTAPTESHRAAKTAAAPSIGADPLLPSLAFEAAGQAPAAAAFGPKGFNVDRTPLGSRSDAVLANTAVQEFGELGADAGSILLLQTEEFQRRFDDIQRRVLEEAAARRTAVASSIMATGGVSIGYVVWLVRGGVLVSSMLSALPAWQMIDPMPVLSAAGAVRGRRKAAGHDDSDVERLFDEPGPAPRPATTQPPVPTTEPAAGAKET
jgi:hypothetical protein